MQWTSLLLTICSCATQHLHLDDKPQLESDFGESVDVLTERYLFAARELSNSIPDGHYHFLNVQRLLHAIYWYKSEARFVEAWHLIGAAVREAQELGLPRDSTSQGLPDFDREMRRRVWCVLSTWDWQFASGLGRPTIIDHRNVEVAQPTLSIEGYNPSPLLHMKLQAESVAILAAKFGAPRNIASTHDIREYTQTLEDWMCTFPAVYSMEDPDHSPDASHPWAVSHRYYIHTMACLMVLNPVRSYMARSYSDTSTEDELWIRKNGVHYALKNLRTTSAWTHHAHQNDGRFHFIIFSLFDTASVLSAAILKDDNYSLPQRAKVLAAIEEAVVLLGRINNLSKTASTSYRLIINIVKRVPGLRYYMRRKRVKVESPGGAVPHLALHDKPGSNGSNAGSRTTSKPNLDNGFETASPSNHYTNGSGTTDTTPSSLTVATPNTDSPNLTPTVHERPISAFSADNYLAFHHEGEPDHDLNAGLQPSFPPLGEAHERLAGMNPYTELQQLEPTDEDNENTPPITDAELGEFSRLWDWGSLNFGFIVSESAPLPMAPDADQS